MPKATPNPARDFDASPVVPGPGAILALLAAAAAVVWLGLVALPAGAQSRPAAGGDVLLTFDTEFEDDADALIALDLDVPATFFWTGAYARLYPDLLRRIAEAGHTIGSHSFHHDDLTTLSPRQLQLDLELAKLVLEDIAGVPVTAFRAPFLEYTDTVMAEVERLGFAVDSSDKSPWPRNRRLPEIAVSEFENLLVSDYDIFVSRRLDNATALDFLIRAYAHHAAVGRPFVVLLHPRYIGRHAEVLRAFIAHVVDGGGRFHTLDGYLDGMTAPAAPRLVGLWAELDTGGEGEALRAAIEASGATDVILSVPGLTADQPGGPTRSAAAIAALQARGVRVHLALPVTRNAALAAARPGMAMVDIRGGRSAEWVSPAHPEVRRRLVAEAGPLVAALGVDGLHLHGLGYPGLSWDFSPAALQRFSAVTGITGATPDEIMSRDYLIWTRWRSSEVASLVEEIAAAARARSPGLVVSVSLLHQSATDYRVQELSGQDFRRYGAVADMIVPWVWHGSSRDPSAVARMLVAARTQTGPTPVLIGLDMRNDMRMAAHRADRSLRGLREAFALASGIVADIRGLHAGTGHRHPVRWQKPPTPLSIALSPAP